MCLKSLALSWNTPCLKSRANRQHTITFQRPHFLNHANVEFLVATIYITYKARRWHPILKPNEIDDSRLGDRFFRQAPYKTEAELAREDSSNDIYGTVHVTPSCDPNNIV